MWKIDLAGVLDNRIFKFLKMKEDFLYYLWQLKRFDVQSLKTTSGEEIMIQNVGELNHDAGPDFLNARIKIGNTLWAGNVEMHLKSSDWLIHQHQKDPRPGHGRKTTGRNAPARDEAGSGNASTGVAAST